MSVLVDPVTGKPVMQRPVMPRRMAWVEIPQYEGFAAQIWVNPPAQLWTDVFNAESNSAAADFALKQIVVEHNGWIDQDGNEIPPANSSEFWEAIPNELAAAVMMVAQQEMGKLAASLAPKRGR